MNDDWLRQELGRRLVRRRNRLELTQGEVAARAGLSRPTLANLELGRQTMLITQLYLLARALDLKGLEELLPSMEEVRGEPSALRFSEENLSAKQRREIQDFLIDVRVPPDTRAVAD